MKLSYLPLVALMVVPGWACSETPPAEPPPQAPAVTAEPAPPPPLSATAQVAPPPTAEPVVAPPPPKPGKEKIQGAWAFSFEGDPKTKAEADAKKKFPKDKDQAKRDDMLKKVADAAAGEWIEFKDGYYISHTTVKDKDKVVLRVKFDFTKDDPSAVTLKPSGKDEISKKEINAEMTITFVDDNTISLVDPKKNMTLIFKRK